MSQADAAYRLTHAYTEQTHMQGRTPPPLSVGTLVRYGRNEYTEWCTGFAAGPILERALRRITGLITPQECLDGAQPVFNARI